MLSRINLKSKFKKNKGMTFAEVMVAISVITLIIFGMFLTMMTLMRSGQKNIDTSAGYMAANTILREHIAEHKYSFSEGVDTGIKKLGGKTYDYKIKVAKSTQHSNAFQITVGVNWKEMRNNSGEEKYSIEISTIVCNRKNTGASF